MVLMSTAVDAAGRGAAWGPDLGDFDVESVQLVLINR